MNTKRAFILNIITTILWLIGVTVSILHNGKYLEICIFMSLFFGYQAFISYKKFRKEDHQ